MEDGHSIDETDRQLFLGGESERETREGKLATNTRGGEGIGRTTAFLVFSKALSEAALIA
jgi:hypothetical protein